MFHEIDSLRVFMALCQSSSIRQGADKLNLTQPAISRRVQKLEDELNVKLFKRTAHGIELTECGDILYRYALQIDSLCTQAKTQIEECSTGRVGEIRIGAGPAWCRSILPKVISHLHQQHPLLKISLVSGLNGTTMAMLAEEKLDLVIGTLQPELNDNDTYIYDLLRENELKVFAGQNHPLHNKTKVELGELLYYPWISLTGSSVGNSVLTKLFSKENLQCPKYDVETSSLQAALAIINGNNFLIVLPDLLEADLAKQEVKPLNLQICILKFPSGMIYRNNGSKRQIMQLLNKTISELL
ncbi:LysR family transcriptional regulator [Leclercia adecarboxylata]|uniref:LysR family transcriptional regulator n=1 Tax=Leclercia adecarboxylata TaxID=83655 RepID=UPI002029C3D8|nr:LysR family transcriptional regulator [Leclercia adecarboxylata]URN97436.1 LysR family transcriptional regulator [Leclercia adecarboxylata]